jgi:hypothetical protein
LIVTRCALLWACLALVAAAPAFAQDKPALTPIFDVVLDFDHDGVTDRAVLVADVVAGFYATDRTWFMLGRDAHADLLIYLHTGDGPLDPSRKPSFIKQNIATSEHNNQIFPPGKTAKGALLVKTAYNLFSNYADETLTIVLRNGTPVVGGLTYAFEWKNGEQGGCDINFLTGKGVASKGPDGKKAAIAGRFDAVTLREWSEKKYPRACKS